MIAAWLVTCLSLASLIAPALAHAQDGAASPVVETPTATTISSAPDPATTTNSTPQVAGEAGGGVGGIPTYVFELSIFPKPGVVDPSGSTLWTASFNADWFLDTAEPLGLELVFSWIAAPGSVTCVGTACGGTATVSGGLVTEVTQFYNAYVSLSGHLVVLMPNPTTAGSYAVTARLFDVNDASRSTTRSVNFTISTSSDVTPTPGPTPAPDIFINGSNDQVVTANVEGSVVIASNGISTILIYPGFTCTPPDRLSLQTFGLPFNLVDPAIYWVNWLAVYHGGNTFSLQGLDSTGEPMTSCRTVNLQFEGATPDATTTPDSTVIVTEISPATITPSGASHPTSTTEPTRGAAVQSLPNTGAHGDTRSPSSGVAWLLGATVLTMLAGLIVTRRRQIQEPRSPSRRRPGA